VRLIDADAKITALLYDEEHEETNSVEMTIADFLDSHTEEGCPQNGGWISVKDGLPKSMANKVLVWVEHEELVGYIGFGHYEKYKGEEMWYDLEHDERFDKHGYTVTYWMPLPEPLKEEN